MAGNTEEIGKYNRINATYNNGPDQLVQTIEANFGIPIEHVVQLNFVGFRGAVDAIGGVNLDFPYPARDTYTGLNITTAGLPARERRLLAGRGPQPPLPVLRGRLLAVRRDQRLRPDPAPERLPEGLINQAEKQYNPLTINAFIGSVVQGVTIDSTFTISDLVSLAQRVPDVRVDVTGHGDAAHLLGGLVGVRLAGFGPLRPAAPGEPGDQPVPGRPGAGAADAAARPYGRRSPRPPRRPPSSSYSTGGTYAGDHGTGGHHDHHRDQLRSDPLLTGTGRGR